jgi:putative peptidoglycan lipid II flippase
MTFVSRLGGLIREQLMAAFFGTSVVKSAFDVAFLIPNLFRRLFGEGALSAAVIPIYTETLEKDGKAAADRFASRVAAVLLASLGVIAAALILLTFPLARFFAGLAHADLPAAFAFLQDQERWQTIFPLLRIMLPYAPLICLAALAMGVINSHKSFAVPALAPLFLNLCGIAALALVCPFLPDDPMIRIKAVSWSIVVAGVVQIAVQTPTLRRLGVPLRFDFHWAGDARLARVFHLMGPVAFSAGVAQVNILIDRFLAIKTGTWGPSALTYAERLVYLPLGLVGTAFGVVLLPTLASLFASGDREAMRQTVERATRNVFTLMLPAAVGMAVLAYPIISLVYQFKGGAFQDESTILTGRALLGYAPGLVFFSLEKVFTPAFYSVQDTRTPVRVSIACMGINVCLNLLLIWLLPEGWEHMGIAAATVVAHLFNCLALVWLLHRRRGLIAFGGVARSCLSALAAGAFMACAAYGAHQGAMFLLARHLGFKTTQIVAMGSAIFLASASYLVALRLLCPSAIRELVADLRHRRARKTER